MDYIVDELYKNSNVKFTVSINLESSPIRNEVNFAIVATCPLYQKGRRFTLDSESIEPTTENLKGLFDLWIKSEFMSACCKNCKIRECQLRR